MAIIMQKDIGSDMFEMRFQGNLNELLDELERREQATIRPAIRTNALTFLTKDDLLKHGYQVKSRFWEENRIFLKADDKVYPVADGAFNSIKNRIDIYGQGLMELQDDLLKKVLNDRFRTLPEVRLIIIDEKVRAIFSTYSGGYKVMPIKEVVEYTLDALESKFEEIEFQSADMSYNMLYLKILFPKKSETIQDLYGKSTIYTPGILLRSSDTGFSSNEIFPIWNLPHGSAVFGEMDESIRMVHRGKSASLENLRDELPAIFVKLKDTIPLIRKQMAYKLRFPHMAAENACKKLKLGKKDTRVILERLDLFSFLNPDTEISGYHITNLLVEMARDEQNESKKRRLETAAGKAFYLKYEKLDGELDD